MGHETLQMIHEKYYLHVKNCQRDNGTSFMAKVYEPALASGEEVPEQDGKQTAEKFTPN